MFTVTFPYDIGTFVRVKKDNSIGTVACYSCVNGKADSDGNQFTIFVSGYKDAWCGEYLLNMIEVLSEEEVKEVKARYENTKN